MKLAFFDTKPHDIASFEKPLADANITVKYLDTHLNRDTAWLAYGYDAVCVFVNDVIDKKVVDILYNECGVKVVVLRCAGYNNVDLEACAGKLPVFRVPAYSPYAVAEHAMALLLTINRRTHKAYNRTREFNFSLTNLCGFDLHGKTVGIVGAGKIGRVFADICKGFGMRVLAYDKYPAPNSNLEYVELDTIFKESDIISLHCPLMNDTYHMVNADAIAAMKKGVTIIMVSHDVDFCASVAHRCALFFGGSIAAEGTPRDFFSGNSFYTTAANRMARHMVADAVTVEEVAAVLGGKIVPPPPPPKFGGRVTPPKEVAKKQEKLPLWRKILGTFCALAAVNLGVWVGVSNDFSVMMEGTTITAEGVAMLWRYVVLLVLAFGCAACFTRRGERPPKQLRQKLSRRSIVGLVVTVVMIPVTAYFGGILLPRSQHGLVSALVLIECMLPFFLVFEGRRPKARELVLLAALCALGVAGRAAFFMLPQCKPVTALSIIAGAAFGGETGFLVGAVSMLVSNMLFGQGPWTPWQMFTMGLIGFVASLLFHSGLLRRTRWTMALFGFVAVLALYGGIMNPASALILYGTQVTGKTLLTYYLTGLPMDCVHAATTALFLFVAAEPLLDTFQRIRGKYGLVELHGKLNEKSSLS